MHGVLYTAKFFKNHNLSLAKDQGIMYKIQTIEFYSQASIRLSLLSGYTAMDLFSDASQNSTGT